MTWKILNTLDDGDISHHGGISMDKVNKYLKGDDIQAAFGDIVGPISTLTFFKTDKLRLSAPTTGFAYKIQTGEITADRNVSFPLLTANATFAFADIAQTFTQTNIFSLHQRFESGNWLKKMTAPSTPTTGYGHLFLDTADNKVKIKKDDASTVTLEAGSSAAPYLVVTLDPSLSADRALIAGAGLSSSDAGANANFTLSANSRVLSVRQSALELVNSTADTVMISETINGGTLGTNGGVRVVFVGDYLNNSGVGDTFTLTVRFGASDFFKDTTISIPSSASKRKVWIEFILSNKNATNSNELNGYIHIGNAGGATTGLGDLSATGLLSTTFGSVADGLAIDTTVNQTLELKIQHTTAHANISFKRTYAVVYLIKP